MYQSLPAWLQQLLPILVLLLAVSVVIARLPRVELGHSLEFRRRRVWNWIPLGLTYAFLYFGRYNLNALKDVKVLTEQQYGDIFTIGAWVYGISFLINGPLTDRLGGRTTILISALGSAIANVLMGLVAAFHGFDRPVQSIGVLYGLNMYFQSFGAVSIVKVNSNWFHLRERGIIGGLFGILISLGLYFAYDWGNFIAENFAPQWVFFIPAATLAAFWLISLILVRNQPSDAGYANFDAGDASSGDTGASPPASTIFANMLKNPAIVTIMAIEWCSGFLRNAIMHWYRDFAKGMGLKETFVYQNWGMLLCVAGILGGVFAGVISDRIFHSRRGPVSAVLYGFMLLGAIIMIPLLNTPAVISWTVVFMSMCIIGVHGMLSGTASADFGGKKNAGIAVGIIDGMVYFGTGIQSLMLGRILPHKGTPEAANVENWTNWPLVMIPIALLGFVLSLRVWNARPRSSASH